MRDEVQRLLDQRPVLGDQRRRLGRGLARHRPDPQRPAAPPHVAQAADPVDVDQVLGVREAEVQQRDQALTAGQDLAVLTVLGQQAQGLVEIAGIVVLERRRLHGSLPG
jgi:hypothetical protein